MKKTLLTLSILISLPASAASFGDSFVTEHELFVQKADDIFFRLSVCSVAALSYLMYGSKQGIQSIIKRRAKEAEERAEEGRKQKAYHEFREFEARMENGDFDNYSDEVFAWHIRRFNPFLRGQLHAQFRARRLYRENRAEEARREHARKAQADREAEEKHKEEAEEEESVMISLEV